MPFRIRARGGAPRLRVAVLALAVCALFGYGVADAHLHAGGDCAACAFTDGAVAPGDGARVAASPVPRGTPARVHAIECPRARPSTSQPRAPPTFS